MTITYQNIHDAYLGTLADVWDNYEYLCSPRGMNIREKLDYSFKVLNPISECLITKDLERNKIIADYTKKEFDLYNSGSNKVEDFAKASKFWEKIANKDSTINSAYGHLIWHKKSLGNVDQEIGTYNNGIWLVPNPLSQNGMKLHAKALKTPWEWCLQSLKKDKDTRQAILRFSLPEHHFDGNKDFVCTLNGNFLIRDNKLNFTIVMRSNDLMLGLVYDLSWFIHLMDKMMDELKTTYPDLEKGTYTHFVHSLHIYERDEEKIMKMIGRK